jgi:hypothetical protein
VIYGTFAVHYTDTQLMITDFEAVPEPSITALTLLGLGLLTWRVWLRRTSS